MPLKTTLAVSPVSIGGNMKSIFRMFSATLLFLSVHTYAANGPQINMEEFMVPAVDPGISLYVRNKHPQGVTKFPGEKILLYVHGATYPSETAFDLKLNGLSWMDYIAQHWLRCVPRGPSGYGKSTRPPEMDKPAAENEPIVRTETAVKDVGAAVDFILKRRGVSKINLLGWSWGTTIMGWYNRAEQPQGQPAGALRATMDPQQRVAHGFGRQARCLPYRLARRCEGPLAHGRGRGQEGQT
jgi:hypothetical protein